jgi:hypothetical protein
MVLNMGTYESIITIRYNNKRLECDKISFRWMISGTNVLIFSKFSEKWRFLRNILLVFAKMHHNSVFKRKCQFLRRKLTKITENCDHNIDSRLVLIRLKNLHIVRCTKVQQHLENSSRYSCTYVCSFHRSLKFKPYSGMEM